jgi:hypothetical protein
MPETIDGNQNLRKQESSIQFKEAKGYRMKSFGCGADNPPTNEADFERLPTGQLPDLFKLVLDQVPSGETEIWNGTIYVEGSKKQAAAYRVAG